METTEPKAPIDQLLALGDPRTDKSQSLWSSSSLQWRDYGALGIGLEHVPELIRVATDLRAYELGTKDPRSWGPMHAWRALGQLRAEVAAEPLVRLVPQLDALNDDWGMEELPRVFAMIGPRAAEVLSSFLNDASQPPFSRDVAAGGLKHIGLAHPESRSQMVERLAAALDRFERNDPTLNGLLVSHLMDLKGIEAAGVMERAFASGTVDEGVAGDWVDVKGELGLGPPRRVARRYDTPGFPSAIKTPPPATGAWVADARARQRVRNRKEKSQRKRGRQASSRNQRNGK